MFVLKPDREKVRLNFHKENKIEHYDTESKKGFEITEIIDPLKINSV